MARLITFRSQVAESLEQGDAMKFQEIFKDRLLETYNKHQKRLIKSIVEEEDLEMKTVSTIQAAAKSFGGHSFIYDQGLLGLFVPEGTSAEGFAEYLDECDDVASYEEDVIPVPVTSESPTDLQGGDGRTEVHYTIELAIDNVLESSSYDDLTEKKCSEKKAVKEEDEENDEEVEEEDEESDEDEEDEEDDEEEMDETTHFSLVRKLNNLVNSVIPIDEVTKVVSFRHTSADSNTITKQLHLPPRPGFKIVDGGYKRMTALQKRDMKLGQIAGARKRARTQVRANKRRNAALKKRDAAGF